MSRNNHDPDKEYRDGVISVVILAIVAFLVYFAIAKMVEVPEVRCIPSEPAKNE